MSHITLKLYIRCDKNLKTLYLSHFDFRNKCASVEIHQPTVYILYTYGYLRSHILSKFFQHLLIGLIRQHAWFARLAFWLRILILRSNCYPKWSKRFLTSPKDNYSCSYIFYFWYFGITFRISDHFMFKTKHLVTHHIILAFSTSTPGFGSQRTSQSLESIRDEETT